MSSWGHAQAGLSVRLREASEAGSAGWLSPPCDGLQHTTLPVFHCLPECAQTHVHRVSDAIQPSHLLSSPSLPFNLCQHQGLFQWVGSFHQVAKVLELQLQHQSEAGVGQRILFLKRESATQAPRFSVWVNHISINHHYPKIVTEFYNRYVLLISLLMDFAVIYILTQAHFLSLTEFLTTTPK